MTLRSLSSYIYISSRYYEVVAYYVYQALEAFAEDQELFRIAV